MSLAKILFTFFGIFLAITSVYGQQKDSLYNTANLKKLKYKTKPKILQIDKINIDFSYSFITDTSVINAIPNSGGLIKNSTDYRIGGGVSLLNLPFEFNIMGNSSNYVPAPNQTKLIKVNFDSRRYLDNIKNRVLQQVKPSDVCVPSTKRINEIKSNYEKELNGEISSIQKDFLKNNKHLNLPSDIKTIEGTDISSLRNTIISNEEQVKYRDNLMRLQDMLSQKSINEINTDSEFVKLKCDIQSYEKLEKLYSKIVLLKEKYANDKNVQNLKKDLPVTDSSFKEYLNQPENLRTVAKTNTSLNFFQKIFMNVNKLDIGQNAANGNQFDIRNLVNSGFNGDINMGRSSIGFIAGKNNNVNKWLQSGLINTVTNEYSGLAGIRMASKTKKGITNSVSLNIFHFSTIPASSLTSNTQQNSYLPVVSHRDAVISFHSEYPIASNQKINFDISKSFGTYLNHFSSDSIYNKEYALGSLFSSQGKLNYSASADYSGYLLKSNVTMLIRKVGLGYNNPGNNLLRRGENELTFSISRAFLKKKLSVKYYTDYRNQTFDLGGKYNYSALMNKIQLGYRVSRTTSFKLMYQQTVNKTQLYNQPILNGGNSRTQFSGSYRLWAKKKYIINNSTLSYSTMKMPIPGNINYNNSSILFSHTSTLVLKKNFLSASIIANHSANHDYYFNTGMFNGEITYSYHLDSDISLSSGLGYYANVGWNKQIGVTQRLNLSFFKKLAVGLEVGYKQNIKTYKNEFINPLFINSMMHYNF